MTLDFTKRQDQQGLRPVSSEEIVGLFEPGIEIEGRMKVSSGMIRVNCQLKGAICSAGAIIVADEGDIEAEIQAGQISVAGKVKGNVHASEQLEIKEHGVLLGDVETPSLAVDPGAYFTGRCDMPTHGLEESNTDEDVSDGDRP